MAGAQLCKMLWKQPTVVHPVVSKKHSCDDYFQPVFFGLAFCKIRNPCILRDVGELVLWCNGPAPPSLSNTDIFPAIISQLWQGSCRLSLVDIIPLENNVGAISRLQTKTAPVRKIYFALCKCTPVVNPSLQKSVGLVCWQHSDIVSRST